MRGLVRLRRSDDSGRRDVSVRDEGASLVRNVRREGVVDLLEDGPRLLAVGLGKEKKAGLDVRRKQREGNTMLL